MLPLLVSRIVMNSVEGGGDGTGEGEGQRHGGDLGRRVAPGQALVAD